MATVEPKFSGVSPAQPQGAYFTVSIAQGAFSDAASTAGGRVSPCGASDFATKPTTLAQSLLVSRGQLRWKLMMNSLAIRSNFRVVNIVTTYGSDAGDTAITTLAFGLVFENPDFGPIILKEKSKKSKKTSRKKLFLLQNFCIALGFSPIMSDMNP